MEILIRDAGEQILGSPESAFSARKAFRTSTDIRGSRSRGHHQNVTELATVGETFQGSFPPRNRGDLVDEQPFNAGPGVEHREDLDNPGLKFIVIRDVIPVQKVRRPAAGIFKCPSEFQFEPRALAKLTRPSNQDDPGLLGQFIQSEAEPEGARLVPILCDTPYHGNTGSPVTTGAFSRVRISIDFFPISDPAQAI